MYQTDIVQDINTSVHHALMQHLDQLDESDLVQYSNALLATLPSVHRSQVVTTAGLLRRYDTPLHVALCSNQQPRSMSVTVADNLRDLARAVILTLGPTEGLSTDAAVGVALVLYKRSVTAYCALHVNTA